jgi:cytidylate kinase
LVPVSVVCISRSTGARGEEVGRRVADSLDFRYVDEEILLAAAEHEGLEPEQLAEAERRRSGLSRLQIDLVTGGALDEMLRSLIRTSLHETAAAGQAVIVAHAASMALVAHEGILRVLVTASRETRARRLAEEEGLDEKAAAREIDRSDKGRAAYFKRFYGIERELPCRYDLVVNTDQLSPDGAAGLILEACTAI